MNDLHTINLIGFLALLLYLAGGEILFWITGKYKSEEPYVRWWMKKRRIALVVISAMAVAYFLGEQHVPQHLQNWFSSGILVLMVIVVFWITQKPKELPDPRR